MSKRKLFEDVDELFVQKPSWTSETKIVGIEIPEFLKKIEMKEIVRSPRFKLAGIEFCIRAIPGVEETEFIGLVLVNTSDEDQTTSVTFTEESGVKRSWQMEITKANTGYGFAKFLSHEKYKVWAKDHGDVFRLKAKVTLHQKRKTTEDEDGWIRYVFNYILVRLP